MKLIATVEGVTSIVLDPAKNTVTVVGEADPVRILNKVRKFRKSATIVSVGPNAPPKEKKEETKKEEKKVAVVVVPDQAPNFCQRCDVWHHWYVTVEDHGYNYCSIL